MTSEHALRQLAHALQVAATEMEFTGALIGKQCETQVAYHFADGNSKATKADYQQTHVAWIAGNEMTSEVQVFRTGTTPYLCSLPQMESLGAMVGLAGRQPSICYTSLPGRPTRPLKKDACGHLRLCIADRCSEVNMLDEDFVPVPVRCEGFVFLAESALDAEATILSLREEAVERLDAKRKPTVLIMLDGSTPIPQQLLTTPFPTGIRWIAIRFSRTGNRVASGPPKCNRAVLGNLGDQPLSWRHAKARGTDYRTLASGACIEVDPKQDVVFDPGYVMVLVAYGTSRDATTRPDWLTTSELAKMHIAMRHATPDDMMTLISRSHKLADKDDVEGVVAKCDACGEGRLGRPRRPKLFGLRVTHVNQIVAQDAKKINWKGQQWYVQNLMELLTRYTMLMAFKHSGATESLIAFREYCRRFGVPEGHLTDNAKAYVGEELTDERENLFVRHFPTATYSPWSNGALERSNAEVEKLVAVMERAPELAGRTLPEVIGLVEEAMSEHTLPSGHTPFDAMFGRPRRLWGVKDAENPCVYTCATEEFEQRRSVMTKIRTELVRLRADKDIHDSLHERLVADTRTIENGELVWWWQEAVAKAGIRPRGWHGPGRLIGRDGVQLIVKQSRQILVLHETRVRPVSKTSTRPADPPAQVPGLADDLKEAWGVGIDAEEVHGPELPGCPEDAIQMAEPGGPVPDIPEPEDIRPEEPVPQASPARSREQLLREAVAPSPVQAPGREAAHTPATPDMMDWLAAGDDAAPDAPLRQSTRTRRVPERLGYEQAPEWRFGRAQPPQRAQPAPVPVSISDSPVQDESTQPWRSRRLRGLDPEHNAFYAGHGDLADEEIAMMAGVLSMGRAQYVDLTEDDQVRYAQLITDAVHAEAMSFIEGRSGPAIRIVKRSELTGALIDTKVVVKWRRRGLLVKVRLTLRGFKDSRWLSITEAKTTTAPLVRQTASHAVRRRWKLKTADMKTAFLQGEDYGEDEEVAYFDPPPAFREAWGMKDDEICMCLRSIYGLKDAPRRWSLKCKTVFKAAALTEHPFTEQFFARFKLTDKEEEPHLVPMEFDESIGTMRYLGAEPQPSAECDLIVTTQVDDFLYAGEAEAMAWFEALCHANFTVGSIEDASDPGGFVYRGIHMQYLENGSIAMDIDEYVDCIQPMPNMPGNCLKQNGFRPLSSLEHEQYRSLIGQMQWAISQAVVLEAYPVKILSKKLATPTLRDAIAANKTLVRMQAEKIPLIYEPWELARGVGTGVIGDASYKGNPDKSSQGGMLLGLLPADPQSGDPFHLTHWGSATVKRSHRSSGGSELINIVACTDASDLLKYQAGFIERAIARCTYVRTDSETTLKLAYGTGVPEEPNLAGDIVGIRQRIALDIWRGEHLSGDFMSADGLTKMTPKAREVLRVFLWKLQWP